MRRQTINRIIFYITGLLILAMGLTLNTKAGLGVSPIVSVSYSISQIMGMNFGNTTMGLYCVFVVVELILHFIRDRRSEKTEGAVLEHANRMNRKLVFLMDVLQIPLSMIFTRFLNLFAKVIPDFSEGEADGKQYAVRFAVLILALILTGIGAAMSLNMRIIPNPGDGIVQAIADCIHKSVGFTKNCFDVFNVTVTICISLLCRGHLIGIGIGTVCAVIGVGRTIAVFNHFTKEKMDRAGRNRNLMWMEIRNGNFQ